jgi:hypothetical protein
MSRITIRGYKNELEQILQEELGALNACYLERTIEEMLTTK